MKAHLILIFYLKREKVSVIQKVSRLFEISGIPNNFFFKCLVIRADDVANLGGLHHQYLPPRDHLQLLDKFLYLLGQTRPQTEATRESAIVVDEDESTLDFNQVDKVLDC